MTRVLPGALQRIVLRVKPVLGPACGLGAWLLCSSQSSAAVVVAEHGGGLGAPGETGALGEGVFAPGSVVGPAGPTGFATSYADSYSCGYPPGPCELAAFASVSCAAATACTAVGAALGDQTPIAEGLEGSSWRLEPVPTPNGASSSTLQGVSCPTAASCLAVGSYYDGGYAPLAELWNGTSWSIRGPPTPPDASEAYLYYVQCASASACMAVGSYESRTTGQFLPLVESWDGTAWTVQAVPLPAGAAGGDLYGVSCPSATACAAVGDYQSPTGEFFFERLPLAEAWNGTNWSSQSPPSPTGTVGTTLNAVWCESASSCTAVGTDTRGGSGGELTVAESWNGTSWTIQPTPDAGESTGFANVSCAPAGTPCEAVGNGGLAESWDGARWTIQPTAPLSDSAWSYFSDVSCTSATACTAVGQYENDADGGAGANLALAERWDGTSWTLQSAQDPPLPVPGEPTGVTPSSATLTGVLNPNGATVTDCHFEYGTSALDSSVPCAQSVGAGTAPVRVSAAISGLTPKTTYYFTLVGTNAGGSVSYYDNRPSSSSFVTSGAGPPVNTSAPAVSGAGVPTPAVGTVLTCSPGAWTGDAPIHFTYSWLRANTTPSTVLSGASATPTYTVTSADQGLGVYCLVTAANDSGSVSAASSVVNVPGAPSVTHYRVELKAWIPFPQVVDPLQPVPGSYLGFPPFGGVADSCYSPPLLDQFATTVLSTYHGDDHTDYGGPAAGASYRVLAVAEFDWDGHQITHFQPPAALGYPPYGQTRRLLDYFGPNGHHQCVADAATATKEVDGRQTSARTFDLEIHSSNPLVHPSPDIDSVLTGFVDDDGSVDLQSTPDEFPSHGVEMVRNGTEIARLVVNDASCLGQSGVLGLSGAYTLFSGLTHTAPALIVHVPVPPPGGAPLRWAQPSPLCDVTSGSSRAAGVFVARRPSAAAASASAAGVRVAPSGDGRTTAGPFITLASAEHRGLVVSVETSGGVLVAGSAGRPFLVSVTGGQSWLGVVASNGRRAPRIVPYAVPPGRTIVAPFARTGARVRRGKRPVRPLRGSLAPRTVASVRAHGRKTIRIRFHVHSRVGSTRTYVLVGTHRPRLVRHGVATLRKSSRIRYFSVDALGDVERPRTLRRS